MTTPIVEKDEPQYRHDSIPRRRSSGDGTVVGDDITTRHDGPGRNQLNTHLTVEVDTDRGDSTFSPRSPSRARDEASRLGDDLEMLKVERQVSADNHSLDRERSTTRALHRTQSRRDDTLDEFDIATNPLHEKAAVYRPPENPSTSLSKFFKKVHSSSFLIRYFTYIVPLVLVLMIPLLLGVFVFKDAVVGGVELMWFSIWLEIIWLTLWAGRILAKCLPYPIGLISSLFTNNDKKWRDLGKQLELPATLFFWMLAVEISFLPTMTNHLHNRPKETLSWMGTMNKVLVAIFVGAILNFVEKIIIQLIAISFHLRTYQDRIEINKFQIGSLVKLYKFSKEKITMDDSEFEAPSAPSGVRTPGMIMEKAQRTTKQALNTFGDVAGKIAGDFTGREVLQSTHPHQVILTLLSSNVGSGVLARRLYRTFAREETSTVHSDDLKDAFSNEEEADAAFSMFDKDMNGDISMEELEAVCVEIGRERKAITASLKDLDSVVSKLDDVLMFVVVIITLLVFISLISTSAAGVLTSAGSTILALSWLFSVTAQEFLQSCVFVFVKHPFDVGDRVGVYGNTGALGRGDDYYVKEIALLYTEFKKMEGHVVQAPNSYLNTLFILNQRRSGGLAEAVPIVIKFGTTLEQIEQLRAQLLEFVTSEKREYQTNIRTELREVTEAHSLTLNVIFFYKSNWQNEGLRLQRRNKFICALMVAMQDLGIEGPRMRYPGQKESFPMYLQQIPHIATPNQGHGGTPDKPNGIINNEQLDQPFVPTESSAGGPTRLPSVLRTSPSQTRQRGESIATLGKRVDFSLGMRDAAYVNDVGDVFEDRDRERDRSRMVTTVSPAGRRSNDRDRSSQDTGRSSSIATQGGSNPPLKRTSTERTDASGTHHNRFFGRSRNRDEARYMEEGMPDIPENSHVIGDRLDPRTGLVSSQAVRGESGPPSSAAGALSTRDFQQEKLEKS